MTTAEPARIVVGVDGSPAASRALEWAQREARLRGDLLEIIHVWEFPVIAFAPYGGTTVPMIAPEDLEKAADELLRGVLQTAGISEGDATVRAMIERGHPADVLIAHAKDADLLVVGSRGHGGFSGMLLGSVSSQVVQHAPCPVVVIRSATDRH